MATFGLHRRTGAVEQHPWAHHRNSTLVTENANQPDDSRSLLTLPNENGPENEPSGDASPMPDVEAQMRRALGLSGAPRPHQTFERAVATKAPYQADRSGAGGQRRRFAQDGEVAVTVMHGRRDQPADIPVNRLAVAETAAAAERTAREKSERALAEARATIHDLQTKLGHASVAQTEMQAAARRDQEAAAAVRAELRETIERLAVTDAAREQIRQRLSAIEADYAAERNARLRAESAVRDADAARTDAERRLRDLELSASRPGESSAHRLARSPKAMDTAATKPRASARRGEVRPAADALEPEPVQWWLMSAKKTKR